jgi:hypothetical protein
MADGISFVLYVVLVGIWMAAWGALGAVVSNSRDESGLHGLIQGVLLGPIGVILIAVLIPKTGMSHETKSVATPVGLTTNDDLYR